MYFFFIDFHLSFFIYHFFFTFIYLHIYTHNIHTVNKFHLFQFESFNSVAELEFLIGCVSHLNLNYIKLT